MDPGHIVIQRSSLVGLTDCRFRKYIASDTNNGRAADLQDLLLRNLHLPIWDRLTEREVQVLCWMMMRAWLALRSWKRRERCNRNSLSRLVMGHDTFHGALTLPKGNLRGI